MLFLGPVLEQLPAQRGEKDQPGKPRSPGPPELRPSGSAAGLWADA